ncbi:MAG TPA: PaaI family thioesterase [Ilumatobacter sp.]|nr:PaaI family thioesterase [Ilumatobacter sp.]
MSDDLRAHVTNYLAKGGSPFVHDLGLVVTHAEPGEVTFKLSVTPRLVHAGGVLCGQAIMAGFDTGMLFVMASLFNGDERMFTTVTLNSVFERGVPADVGEVTFHAWATKPGRSLVFGQIDCHLPTGQRAATATTTYMWL